MRKFPMEISIEMQLDSLTKEHDPPSLPMVKIHPTVGPFPIIIHNQNLNGTESQRTPDQVSCYKLLLDTQVFVGVREFSGSCGSDFLDLCMFFCFMSIYFGDLVIDCGPSFLEHG